MAEAICQEGHLLQLPACLYKTSSTGLPSYSVLLDLLNRDLNKERAALAQTSRTPGCRVCRSFVQIIFTAVTGKTSMSNELQEAEYPQSWLARSMCAQSFVCVPTPLQLNNLLTKKARGPEGAGAAPASIMETNVCKASVFYSNKLQTTSLCRTNTAYISSFFFCGFVGDFLGFFGFLNFFTV